MLLNLTEADEIIEWLKRFTPTKAADATNQLGWRAVKNLERLRWPACYQEFSELWNGHDWGKRPPWSSK